MHCTKCGATLVAGAKYCGACGEVAVVSGSSKTAPPRIDQVKGCAVLLLIAGVIALVLSSADSDSDPAAVAAAAKEVAAKTIDPRICDDAIAGLEATGLIKERPAPNRVNVEDALWAAMPATEKRLVAQAVRCSLTRGKPSVGFDDYSVVYGYRSGQRLAQAVNETTVTIE